MSAIRREPGDEITLEQVSENRVGLADHSFQCVEEAARLGDPAIGEQAHDVRTERGEEVRIFGWRTRRERPALRVPLGGERRECAAERGLEVASRHEPIGRVPNGSAASQRKAIAALLLGSGLEDVIVRRDIDDANELGPESLAGAAGREVLGIACDPQRLESMTARQGQDQPARSLGKALAAKRRRDLVPNVPGIVLDRMRAADAKADSPNGVVHAVETHREAICGNPAARGVLGLASAELEPEIAVAEGTDVVE